MYTHLGCFGAQGEAGESEKVLENMFHQSRFPIRQAAGLLGLGFAPEFIGLGIS